MKPLNVTAARTASSPSRPIPRGSTSRRARCRVSSSRSARRRTTRSRGAIRAGRRSRCSRLFDTCAERVGAGGVVVGSAPCRGGSLARHTSARGRPKDVMLERRDVVVTRARATRRRSSRLRSSFAGTSGSHRGAPRASSTAAPTTTRSRRRGASGCSRARRRVVVLLPSLPFRCLGFTPPSSQRWCLSDLA